MNRELIDECSRWLPDEPDAGAASWGELLVFWALILVSLAVSLILCGAVYVYGKAMLGAWR